MDRSSKQKINKETQVLNNIFHEMDLIDIFRTIHPNAEEYTVSSAHGKQKKFGVAILISDKIGLKIKKNTRDKEGHYIMIKGSIQEEDITIVHPT